MQVSSCSTSSPSLFSPQAKNDSLMLFSHINSKLEEAIDEISNQARAEGVEISTHFWIIKMRQLQGRASESMLELIGMGATSQEVWQLSRIYFDELDQIEMRVTRNTTLANQKHKEIGQEHVRFNFSLKVAPPVFVLPPEKILENRIDRVIDELGYDVFSKKHSPPIKIPQAFHRDTLPQKPLKTKKVEQIKNDVPVKKCVSTDSSEDIFYMELN